jgi:ferric-dicitrate binding protein FerR (iron transport regulator)
MARPSAGTPQGADAKSKVPREILAEAAVWVTRLHGPDRSLEMERDFRAWQALSPSHREAFEKCTDAWIDVGKIRVATAYETVALPRRPHPGGGGGVKAFVGGPPVQPPQAPLRYCWWSASFGGSTGPSAPTSVSSAP